MKVAIAGCGQISSWHISALKEIEGMEIVALVDRDEQRPRQMGALAPGARLYGDMAEMIRQERPASVHILTPPASHAVLAIQAMEAGAHVLVEKPMALSVEEADRMIAAANANGVKLSTNHNYLFNPSVAEARRLVKSGAIGKVVYVDSYYGLSGEGGSYSGAGGRFHWAYRLPGGAFTNFLPHLISLQRAFLGDIESVEGVALAHDGGADGQPTELTALVQGRGAAGVMAVSMRAKPYAKFVDIYGTQGIVHADLVREICTINRTRRLPSMVSKVAFSTETAVQIVRGTVSNTVKVVLGRMKPYAGLRNLVRAFYESIEGREEQPSPGEEGRRMVQVMEMVWAQARAKDSALTARAALEVKEMPRPEPRSQAERAVRSAGFGGPVLVTGATGFLGHRLVAALWRAGVDVVALVRDPGLASPELQRQARLVRGDVRDPASLGAAMQGVSVVFHCAAITSNSVPWQVHREVNVLGAQAVFEAALKTQVRRVVHVSSVVVYGLGRPADGTAPETTGYARRVDGWANYVRSKLEADRLAFTFGRESGLAITVARLGILYGPGGTRGVGRGLVQMGPLRILPGSGNNHLPYTYVDNAVDGLLLAGLRTCAEGQAYNIVDEPQPTAREVARESARLAGESVTLVPSPAFLLLALARLLELKSRFQGTRVPPKLTRYVVNSAIRDIRYDTSKAQKDLGWQPAVSLEEGLRRTVASSGVS